MEHYSSQITPNYRLYYTFLWKFQNYLDRGPKDKITYSEHEFIKQKDLFQWHFHNFRDKYDPESWRNRFLHIDTSITNLEDTTKQIKTKIKQIL